MVGRTDGWTDEDGRMGGWTGRLGGRERWILGAVSRSWAGTPLHDKKNSLFCQCYSGKQDAGGWGVSKGLSRILGDKVSYGFNVSQYGTTWTHFKSISNTFRQFPEAGTIPWSSCMGRVDLAGVGWLPRARGNRVLGGAVSRLGLKG